MVNVRPPASGALSIGAAARKAGDRLALVAGRRRWTWSELHEAVAGEDEKLRQAEGLRANAAERPAMAPHPVAFDAHPGPETVIRLLALIEAEVCAIPLHPRLPPATRAALLRLAAPCIDLDAGEAVVAVRGADAADVGDLVPLRWCARPGTTRQAARPLAVLFTSGSSGSPRAVELSRAAFRASAAASAAHLGWQEDDRWLCCLPLAHVGGLSIVIRCLLARRAVVLTAGFDAADVIGTIEREAVTLASFVPTMLHRLFESDAGWRSPDHLRAVLVGGGPVHDRLWAEIERRALPALATYGTTETCAQVATGRFDAPRRLVPLEGVRLRIRDGRVEVAGPMLCSRVGVPAADEGPVWTPDGFLRTGDSGQLRNGKLTIHGRADDLIITGGENVAPAEVEAVLVAHPAVRRAVVFGVPDEQWGEVVAAALEAARDHSRPSNRELRSWLEARLPSFGRPRRILWLTQLPETPVGKPDRSAAAVLGRSGAEPI